MLDHEHQLFSSTDLTWAVFIWWSSAAKRGRFVEENNSKESKVTSDLYDILVVDLTFTEIVSVFPLIWELILCLTSCN